MKLTLGAHCRNARARAQCQREALHVQHLDSSALLSFEKAVPPGFWDCSATCVAELVRPWLTKSSGMKGECSVGSASDRKSILQIIEYGALMGHIMEVVIVSRLVTTRLGKSADAKDETNVR